MPRKQQYNKPYAFVIINKSRNLAKQRYLKQDRGKQRYMTALSFKGQIWSNFKLALVRMTYYNKVRPKVKESQRQIGGDKEC